MLSRFGKIWGPHIGLEMEPRIALKPVLAPSGAPETPKTTQRLLGSNFGAETILDAILEPILERF